jgi:PAS domain S-box-containing protein
MEQRTEEASVDEGTVFTVGGLIRLFYRYAINGIPVVDDMGRLMGLVTKSNLVKASSFTSNLKLSIKQIISDQLTPIDREKSPEEVLESIVGGKEIAELPVIDRAGKLVAFWNPKELSKAARNYDRLSPGSLGVVLKALTKGVVVVDGRGIIAYVNGFFEHLTGIKESDAVGQELEAVIPHTKLMQAVEKREEIFEIRIGTEGKPVVYDAVPIVVDGDVVGGVLVVDDLHKVERIASQISQIGELEGG